jgi:hypothetical protein
MTSFLIHRAGNSPLGFDGELLSSSEGRCRNSREQNRWHNISIYRTKGGGYVVAIEFHTFWVGEEDRSFAEDCKEPTEVLSVLRSYDPEEGVCVHTPNNPKFDARSANTLGDLRRRFETQISEVLADHPEFAERID